MKKIKYVLSILGLVLAVIISFNIVSTAVAAGTDIKGLKEIKSQDTANINSKKEIVYGRLDSDGSMSGIYVVNHFEVTKAGLITDYGDYTKVDNLTDTNPIHIANGLVSFNAGEGNYYYQGNTASSDLPWIFDIEYRLNGSLISPLEIAGQSGALEIDLSSRTNANVDSTFYDNYMLQISVSLDTDKSSNIIAPNAITASGGKSQILSYTVMPGKDADISIKADVDNFTMAGIEITGMPFSSPVELPDTGGALDEMTLLSDAINNLNSGIGELNTGVGELNTGVGELMNGSANFAQGLSDLNANSGKLTGGSEEIKRALSNFAAALNNSNTEDNMELDDLSQLPKGLRQMSQGLGQLSSGLSQLKGGYTKMYNSLDTAIMAIPTIKEEDIYSIYAFMEGMEATDNKRILGELLNAYRAGQTVLGTYTFNDPNTGVSIRKGMAAIGNSLDTMAESINTMVISLNSMADGIEESIGNNHMLEQIQQLASGVGQLSDNYNAFHMGLVEYTNGVGQISSGYNKFHGGIVDLKDGTDELYEGTSELYGGTKKLNDSVSDLPNTIQVEVDKLMEEYTDSDFAPVSFTSSRNNDTEFVQFVIISEGISIPETNQSPKVETVKETFWDRLLALFK